MGIDNTGRWANEYLPYPDADNKELGKYETQDVQGKHYGDFVISEVMPLIQKKYRVMLGPQNTGLGGSSYGGAVTLYTVLAHPSVFGKALIESPSLLIGDGQLLKDAEKATQFPQRMYLAIRDSGGCGRKGGGERRGRCKQPGKDSARQGTWASSAESCNRKRARNMTRSRGRNACRVRCCFSTEVISI